MFILYYLVIFISCFAYFLFATRVGIRAYSFSNIFFVLVFLLGGLPGYYVSFGVADETIRENFYRGVDYRLYIIYMLTMVIASFGIILGNLLANNKMIRAYPRSNVSILLGSSLLIIFLYALAFFYWLPGIPIFSIFKDFSVLEAATLRLEITHGMEALNPPFIFRFWRNFLQYFLPILFLSYIAKRKLIGRKI